MAKLILLCLAGLVAGCATFEPPPVTANHPASPDALSAPLAPPSSVLAIDKTTSPSMPPAPQTGMDMTTPAATSPGMPKASASAPSSQPARAAYTCPMHPEVLSDKPGACPKCGMALVRKEAKNGGQ